MMLPSLLDAVTVTTASGVASRPDSVSVVPSIMALAAAAGATDAS